MGIFFQINSRNTFNTRNFFNEKKRNECYCGNSDERKYSILSNSKCGKNCPNDSPVMCGGRWANSIYKISKRTFRIFFKHNST